MDMYILGTAADFVGTTDSTAAAVAEEHLLRQAETGQPQLSCLLEMTLWQSDFC